MLLHEREEEVLSEKGRSSPCWDHVSHQLLRYLNPSRNYTLKFNMHIKKIKKNYRYSQFSFFFFFCLRNSTLVWFLPPLIIFLCLSFLLAWLSWLLQPQLFACCSFAQTPCPDLITAKNRDPTHISTSDHSQVSLYLISSHLHSLYICGEICD